jgi:sulfate adenylyltransferase subunit 1 (EFTu-like GTPase family)
VVPVLVTGIESLVDIDTFAAQPAPAHLALNHIGKVRPKTARPIAFDSYVDERATGALVLLARRMRATLTDDLAKLP